MILCIFNCTMITIYYQDNELIFTIVFTKTYAPQLFYLIFLIILYTFSAKDRVD